MTLALKNTETEPVPTHRGAHPEIAPSATRSAPAAEPNDLLPALDSGREKLLSSTEVESTLKDWPTQEQASLKEQAEEKAAGEVAIAAAAEDAEEMELKAAAKRLRRLRKNQKMEEEATQWLARTLALILQQAQSSEPSVCSAATSSTYSYAGEDGNPLIRRRRGHGPAAHALANGCRPRVAL